MTASYTQESLHKKSEVNADDRTNVLAMRMEDMGKALKEGFSGLAQILTPIAMSLTESATSMARSSIKDGKAKTIELRDRAVTTADDFVDSIKDFLGEFTSPLLALAALAGLALGSIKSYFMKIIPNTLKGIRKIAFAGLRAWPKAIMKALGIESVEDNPISKSIGNVVDTVEQFFLDIKTHGLRGGLAKSATRINAAIRAYSDAFVNSKWLPKFVKTSILARRMAKHMDNMGDAMMGSTKGVIAATQTVEKGISKLEKFKNTLVAIGNGLVKFSMLTGKFARVVLPLKLMIDTIKGIVGPLMNAASGIGAAFAKGARLASKIAWPLTVILSAFKGITEFTKELESSGSIIKATGAALGGVFDVVVGDLLGFVGSMSNKILTFLGLDALGNYIENLTDNISVLAKDIIMKPFEGLYTIVDKIKAMSIDGWGKEDIIPFVKLMGKTIYEILAWPFKNIANVIGVFMGKAPKDGEAMFNKTWTKVKGMGGSFFSSIGSFFVDRISSMLSPFQLIKTLFVGGEGKDIGDETKNDGTRLFVTMKSFIIDKLKLILNPINAIGAIFSGVESFGIGESLKELGSNFIATLKEQVLSKVKYITNPVNAIASLFGGKGEEDESVKGASKLKEKVGSIFEGVKSKFDAANDYLSRAVVVIDDDAVKSLTDTVSKVGSSVSSGLNSIMDKKEEITLKAKSASQDAGSTIVKGFGKFIDDGKDMVKDRATNMFETIGTKLSEAGTNALSAIRGLETNFDIGSIVDVGKKLIDSYFQVVENIVSGASAKMNNISSSVSAVDLDSVVLNIRKMMGTMLMDMLPTSIGTAQPIMLDGMRNDVKSAFGLDSVRESPSRTRMQAETLKQKAPKTGGMNAAMVNNSVVAPTNVNRTQNINSTMSVKTKSQTIVNGNL